MKYPYLHRYVTRHGKTLWYVRLKRGKPVRVQGEYGSDEFTTAYRAALAGVKPEAPKLSAQSLAWLVSRYRETLAWQKLAVSTKRQRENIFKHILAKNGQGPYEGMTKGAILTGMDARGAHPAAARHFLETLRGLYQWALKADLVKVDPTAAIETPRKATQGHHTWTDDECARFEARWPLGTRERLAYDILRHTGLRRGDAVRLGPQHVRNGVAVVTTEKTGTRVAIRIPPQLAASIEAGPCGDMVFIAREDGRPRAKAAFGNWFKDACVAAGVPGTAHGLRKTGATEAAEAGATEHELMALFGWTQARTAAIYTQQARRDVLANQASEKIQTANRARQNLSGGRQNPKNTQVKSGSYPAKKG